MSGKRSPKSSAGAKERRPTIDELDRDRRGKEPFTNAEVLARWRRIRDASLCFVEDLLIHAGGEVPKFLASVVDTAQKAQTEIDGLERMLNPERGERGTADQTIYIGWLPEPEPDDAEA